MRQMVSKFQETEPVPGAPRKDKANGRTGDKLGKMLTAFNLLMKSMTIYDGQT